MQVTQTDKQCIKNRGKNDLMKIFFSFQFKQDSLQSVSENYAQQLIFSQTSYQYVLCEHYSSLNTNPY